MSDTTANLEIIAKIRDLVTPGMRSMGDAGTRELNRLRDGGAGAGRALEELGKKTGGMRNLSLAVREGASGLLMFGGAADGAAGKIAGLVGHMTHAFATGNAIGLGIAAVGGLIGLLGERTAKAREEAEKLAEAQAKAAEEARRAAAEHAAAISALNQRLDDELSRLNAVGDAEKRAVDLTIQHREHMREVKTVEEALAVEARDDAIRKATEDRATADEFWKNQRAREESLRKEMEQSREQGRIEADKRILLREQAEERQRLAGLSAEELKWDEQKQRIQRLIKEGYTDLARAEQESLLRAQQQEKSQQASAASLKKIAEQKKILADLDKQAADAAEKEKRQHDSDEQLLQSLQDRIDLAKAENEEQRKGIQLQIEQRDAARQHAEIAGEIAEKYREISAAEADAAKKAKTDGGGGTSTSSSSGGGGGRGPVSVTSGEGPLAQIRQHQAEERQRRRNQNHFNNLVAEGRIDRNGNIIDSSPADQTGGFGIEGDMPMRKKGYRFHGPGGAMPDDEGGSDHPTRGGGMGGKASSGGGYDPVTTPKEPNAGDGRGGQQAQNLAEALKKNEEAAKASAEMMDRAATAGTAAAKSADEASKSAGEVQKSMDDLSTSVSGIADSLKGTADAAKAAATSVAQDLTEIKNEVKGLKDALAAVEKLK